MSKYNATLKRRGKVGVGVVPLVIETGGFIGQHFIDFLKTIEKESGDGPSKDNLLSQISVTLVKANVECLRDAAHKALG